MRDIVTPQAIYPALQALLGLPDHCISFELRVAAGGCGVTVACEHYVALDAPGIKQLESMLSEYELVRRPAVVLCADGLYRARDDSASVIGFDEWMGDRIEHAHREFMDRTSRLPV